MKEFIEKLIGRLEKQAEQYRRRGFEHEQKGYSAMADKYYGKQCSYLHSIEIVNELAEEYINTSNDTSEDYRSTLERYYEKGLNDAWELARKVSLDNYEGAYSVKELKNIFGFNSLQGVFRHYSIQEALAKLEAYEKSKEIKVGDIVKDGKNYFLVTKRYNNTFEGMSDEGYLHCGLSLRDCEKTSKHIDLTDIFKQIGGAE